MEIAKEELGKDGLLLKKIPKKDRTIELCKIAVEQNPLALQFVDQDYKDAEICLKAVEKDVRAFQYIPDEFITKEMCERAVDVEPKLLKEVPKRFKTLEICKKAVKKNISVRRYVPVSKRSELFDKETELAVLKKIVTNTPRWIEYMPNRPDIRELCIRRMEKDFSFAEYMPEEIKASNEILNYQKSKGKLELIEKWYDGDEKVFKVKCKVRSMEIYEYLITGKFENFYEFYNFINEDLSDAELRDYDFNGINLREYDITKTVINSNVLQMQGLYDESYYSPIKEVVECNKDDILVRNEIAIKDNFCYLKPVENEGYGEYEDFHIPFFYISDIHLEHRICNKFKDKATKEEVRSYIKNLVKKMVNSIGTKPYNSYLLIAGDTSSIFELAKIFYYELVLHWDSKRIIVIAGNHELWDPKADMEKNIEIYRRFFKQIGITFLQNELYYAEEYMDTPPNWSKPRRGSWCEKEDMKKYTKIKSGIISEKELQEMSEEEIKQVVWHSPIIILGGIGFSGLNDQFNASSIRFGKSFEELSREEALQKDIQESEQFNALYKKVLKALYNNRVLVLTHTSKEDWNAEIHNSNWIYLNGHTHHNFSKKDNMCTIYADNQIGYKANNMGLKYFYCDNGYDVFADYQDGIYEITKMQYMDFYRGKKIDMEFNREGGKIYMIKRKNTYMFTMYTFRTENSLDERLYLMEGGKLGKLERNSLEDLSYYYGNLEKFSNQAKLFLERYSKFQKQLAKLIKQIGGDGRIHGCIIDINYYCHLFVNPRDGKVTPYFAHDIRSRTVYKDFKALLQIKYEDCERIAESNGISKFIYERHAKEYKQMLDNYLNMEEEFIKNFPASRYSWQIEEFEGREFIYDDEPYIYQMSGIIKRLQYLTEKNVVRLWNERLLNYNLFRPLILL